MKNVKPAFEFRNDDKILIGYKEIGCHIIFDVNMDLISKRRLVAGGHKNDPPKDSTYARVVSRDSVSAPWVATTAAWPVPAARGPTRTAQPLLLALGRYRTQKIRVME